MRCGNCALVFVPREFHLAPEEEKKRYDLHQNDPGDEGYRAFLTRLLGPLSRVLSPGARGLDYGCGPGPAVSVMLGELGFEVTNYDPFYADDKTALETTYDFVTCTETVEHFGNPGPEWDRLAGLVGEGGLLGVMTSLRAEGTEFSSWRYKDDPTHVCFYSAETLRWIACRYGLVVGFYGDSAAIFRKREGSRVRAG